MANKGYFSYKNKYNKEYGYEKEQSHNLKQISKDTGVSMKGLQQIYNKGIGAYKTNPSSVRPSVKSKEQWAMARVYSSVMGGKASKIDANELKMAKGGGVGNLKFKIKSQEDRTEISIKDIGSVTLVETYPKYEFQEDLSEKEFDKLGLDEDDIIGKIEHIEINDEYKGKGYAKLLMKKAIEVADKKGLMPLYLNASPMGFKGLNIKDLTSFYESFGFKVFFEQGNNNLMILDKKLAKGGRVKNSVTQKEYLEYLIDVSLEMDIANQNLIDYLKLKGVSNIGLLPTEIKNDLKYKELFTKFNVAKGKASSKVNVKLSSSADRMVRMDALQEYKKILANEIEKQYKMAKGGGVGNFPAKGELVNKENYLVEYEKIGSQYEFYVYRPITKSVSSYEQKKYVCVNQNCPLKMSYNQFINYLYAETYLDNLEYAEGGGVSSKINLLHTNTKTYEDLSKIKGQVVNDLPKSKSVPEIDIQIVDSLNFEGKGKKINNSKDAYIIFNDLWDKEKMVVHEEMNVLFVNKANNVIGYYKHSKGGIDGTVADVEMICSLAVKSLAKGVIVAHNHPSGNLIPSNADIQVSKELKDALKLFKISLLDSIIITKDNYKSLADESLFDIGGRVGNIENFSLARFEDFDEEDERENEENEKGAILLEAIEYGRKTLDQNLLPKLLGNTELSNIIFIYLSKYKEFNLYKLGWRIQFGLSKKWVGLCSVKEYEKMGVGKESKNRNLYLSSQFHKYDKNWKTNIKETVHHEMAHAVVRELFYFSDDTFGIWSRFSEIDPLNEQTEGHGKIWEMICNTILEGGGCSRYAEGLDLEVQFKDWKYECFNCGTKKFGNRSNFATKCISCGKSVLIQKNKY